MSVLDHSALLNDGTTQELSVYSGKVILIVNTASECGLTPQYEGLEKLYQKYQAQGLIILGFPCDQFGGQEPGSDPEILSFCTLNFGVTFPLFSKIEVNGPQTHPLFKTLKKQAPGLLKSQKIKWNFTKFLIGRDGGVIKRFAPTMTPESLCIDIERALAL